MNLLDELKSGVVTYSAEEMIELGKSLANIIPENISIALHGDLGSGKTTFVKGLGLGWGVTVPITSPSYNIFLLYKASRNLLHLDAYRLQNEEQAEGLMLEEFLEEPYNLIVEWPDNIPSYLSKETWHFYFSINADHSHAVKLKL